MKNIKEITTEELFEIIEDHSIRIIDARPVDAYNGWKLNNESRGGHIRGAKSLPAKWAKYIDWIEMVRSKGIHPKHQIIVYGYNLEQVENVIKRFLNAGYEKILYYKNFIDEWVKNESLPMEKLDKYHILVYPEWVKAIIDGKKPPGHKGGKTVICHAHYRNRDAYLSEHIPTAIDIDTLSLESDITWNRHSSEKLEATFKEHGITADTTVILYGKFMYPDNNDQFPGSAAGQLAAIRSALIMMYAGVKDVRILNGGFQSWKDAGYDTSTEDVEKEKIDSFGAKIPQAPELFVDLYEAKKMLASRDADLVCMRSWPEYIGEVSGYNYIEKSGRIPGAIFGNCGSDAYHMENYRNFDHTTREYHEIEKDWKEAGINPDKHLAFYCGTGWRGSEAFLNAWLMGWPRVSVFDGGWFEWSNEPGYAFETGVPKG